VRVSISDVASLHELRDHMLTGRFAQKMNEELMKRSTLRFCPPWAALEVSADASHFATEYESSIMCLNKLTPHQTECLLKMEEASASEASCCGW
jgi:hypothetical protein